MFSLLPQSEGATRCTWSCAASRAARSTTKEGGRVYPQEICESQIEFAEETPLQVSELRTDPCGGSRRWARRRSGRVVLHDRPTPTACKMVQSVPPALRRLLEESRRAWSKPRVARLAESHPSRFLFPSPASGCPAMTSDVMRTKPCTSPKCGGTMTYGDEVIPGRGDGVGTGHPDGKIASSFPPPPHPPVRR